MEVLFKTHMIRTSKMSDVEFLAFVLTHPVSGGDRAAQSAAKKAEAEAVNTAGTERGNAAAANAQLVPFYKQEMNAQHLYNPNQLNTLLNAAEAPLAGSAATAAGQAASQAARTRNSSGFSAALDQNARDRQAALGQAGLNIAGQDIEGAKKLNQAGAAGMMGLFGTDTNAMLEAMGQESKDINAWTDAGKTGWFQNLTSGLDTFGNLYKNLKGGGK